MIRKGGYIIVDLTSENLYDNLEEAIASQKPILLVDGTHTPLYATTIVQDTNKITINGQYVVNSDNTTSGELTGLVLEGIFDKDGNPRFIEGDVYLNDGVTGITKTYGRWSLSGSHLMIVLAGTIEANTTIGAQLLSRVTLPSWIMDKIFPSGDTEKQVAVKYAEQWEDNNTPITPIMYCGIQKNVDTAVDIATWGSKTFTNETYIRIQFDLLIDND